LLFEEALDSKAGCCYPQPVNASVNNLSFSSKTKIVYAKPRLPNKFYRYLQMVIWIDVLDIRLNFARIDLVVISTI